MSVFVMQKSPFKMPKFTKYSSQDKNFSRAFKDTLKAFGEFKNKHQKCTKCFLICQKIHILKVYSKHYTLRWNTDVKNVSFGQNKRYQKYPLFFFRELQLITFLLLICDSYMNWSTKFVSLKLCVGFSIFGSVSFLLKFIFLFNKMHGLFDFKAS